MSWSRSTIGLFSLSLTFMVLAGFMLLMYMGTEADAPGHDFARYALPTCVLGFFASGAAAWVNHRRQKG